MTRLQAILEMLRERPHTVVELTAALPVSIRRIEADLCWLRTLGFEISQPDADDAITRLNTPVTLTETPQKMERTR